MNDGLLFKLILTLVLVTVGFLAGRLAERKHLGSLAREEALLQHIQVFPRRFQVDGFEPELVTGSVVVAQDYFKMSLAMLISLIGGRLKPYESLLERARREAVVRMKREAEKKGAKHIYGFRLEVTSVDDLGGMVEAIAYGTALKRLPHATPDTRTEINRS